MSADNLFSASSNDNLVLVLFSKKTLATVRCLNVGTFLIGLDSTSLNFDAVSNISSISSNDKSFIPNKSLELNLFITFNHYIIFFKSLLSKINSNPV